MLEMQEECRREMMKDYIQANNPAIFEQAYHNIVYNCVDEPVPNHQPPPAVAATTYAPQHNHQQQSKQSANDVTNSLNNLNLNSNNQETNTFELVKKNLNPNASEFVPKKYLDSA